MFYNIDPEYEETYYEKYIIPRLALKLKASCAKKKIKGVNFFDYFNSN